MDNFIITTLFCAIPIIVFGLPIFIMGGGFDYLERFFGLFNFTALRPFADFLSRIGSILGKLVIVIVGLAILGAFIYIFGWMFLSLFIK